jgi:hypothetical protein
VGDDKKSIRFFKNIVWLFEKPKNYIYFLTIISSIFVWSKNLNDQELDVDLQLKELNWKSEEKSNNLNLDIFLDNSILDIWNWIKPIWLWDLNYNFSLQKSSNIYIPEDNLIKPEEKIKKIKKIKEINTRDLIDLNAETSKQNFIKAFWTWLWADACFLIDWMYWWWKGQFLDTIRAIAISEWRLKFRIRSEDLNNWNNISTFQINGKSVEDAERNYLKFYSIWIKFIKDKLELDIPKNFVKWNISISQEELISYIWYLYNRSFLKNEDLFYLLSNISPSDEDYSEHISITVQWWIRKIWENVAELLNWESNRELINESF